MDVWYRERTEVIAAPSVRQPPSGAIVGTRAITPPLVIALAEVALESRELAELLGIEIETASALAALGTEPFPTINSLLRNKRPLITKERSPAPQMLATIFSFTQTTHREASRPSPGR